MCILHLHKRKKGLHRQAASKKACIYRSQIAQCLVVTRWDMVADCMQNNLWRYPEVNCSEIALLLSLSLHDSERTKSSAVLHLASCSVFRDGAFLCVVLHMLCFCPSTTKYFREALCKINSAQHSTAYSMMKATISLLFFMTGRHRCTRVRTVRKVEVTDQLVASQDTVQ